MSDQTRGSTARAVSPDSGLPWAEPGAWPTAPGVHRIPLPLPMDGLRAVNVYLLEGDDGLTMIDGGWAITEGRDALESALRGIGHGVGDIDTFLVTHAHRDHYTLASVLGAESGASVSLGGGDRDALELLQHPDTSPHDSLVAELRRAGALDVARRWTEEARGDRDVAHWRQPSRWLEGDLDLEVDGRVLSAVHTPGHTPGHYVFVDPAADLMFAGDHVLPTITPSVGFIAPPPPDPLGDFMRSLAKVRALPDRRLLPAHGPVADSVHVRADELLTHHEERLGRSLAAFGTVALSATDVAGALPWTRRERDYATLDTFNRGLASMETRAHLEVLVARGRLVPAPGESDVVRYQRPADPG